MQEVVPSCPVYIRGCRCRWPSAHFLVQRPRLGEICIGGQSLTVGVALLLYTEEKRLTAILVCGALTKPVLVLVMSEMAISLLRAAIRGGQLQTRAALEQVTEAKSIRNSHHQSILPPKTHNLHYPAQHPTLWSTLVRGILEAYCKNIHKFLNMCFLHSQIFKLKSLTKINELDFQKFLEFPCCPLFLIQIRWFFN